MDQEKVGRFIASCRKEQGLTQAKLAEKFGITDRAVSKWENGKCLPDCSIMIELCNLLKINVNELLSGERLDMEQYKEKAEENLFLLKDLEQKSNKRLLSLEVVIGYISSISFLVIVFTASFVDMPNWIRGVLIGIALIIFIIGMYNCLKLEHDAGYYECQDCGERYVPSMKAVFFAPHIGRSRRLKCPHCGSKNFHKKILIK
ncbi:MAG: helix-turn-helix domain-containing protein [Treponema sp.]|nr:helix-turn-helix domain-containing protein [Treponema sp.]